MLLIYSLILSLGFLLMLPMFLIRREKYASGFRERLGNYPEFKHDGRKVIWLHCVSVGETNAARPLVAAIQEEFPDHRLVISTTTKTGQELARKIFTDKSGAIFYFPFDWKFSVRRAIENYKPSLVLLMETEIWPRFLREAKLGGSKTAIVNGRLSQRSFGRYSRVRTFVRRAFADIDLAVMQNDADAMRIVNLGLESGKVAVSGNLKFEQSGVETDNALTKELAERFGITAEKPLVLAASTHEPEEKWILESLIGELDRSCRLMIAPRHPERFDAVEKLLQSSSYPFVRRSATPAGSDREAAIILLDTIGELRSAYPLAEIVFVGGSLIPHGGQSVLEPAAAAKAIVTGPYTHNFEAVIEEFVDNEAIIQTPEASGDSEVPKQLHKQFTLLLQNRQSRIELGKRAAIVMGKSNRNATAKTIDLLRELLARRGA